MPDHTTTREGWLLAAAYAAEVEDANLPMMDSATALAWRLGYRKPVDAGREAAAPAA